MNPISSLLQSAQARMPTTIHKSNHHDHHKQDVDDVDPKTMSKQQQQQNAFLWTFLRLTAHYWEAAMLCSFVLVSVVLPVAWRLATGTLRLIQVAASVLVQPPLSINVTAHAYFMAGAGLVLTFWIIWDTQQTKKYPVQSHHHATSSLPRRKAEMVCPRCQKGTVNNKHRMTHEKATQTMVGLLFIERNEEHRRAATEASSTVQTARCNGKTAEKNCQTQTGDNNPSVTCDEGVANVELAPSRDATTSTTYHPIISSTLPLSSCSPSSSSTQVVNPGVEPDVNGHDDTTANSNPQIKKSQPPTLKRLPSKRASFSTNDPVQIYQNDFTCQQPNDYAKEKTTASTSGTVATSVTTGPTTTSILRNKTSYNSTRTLDVEYQEDGSNTITRASNPVEKETTRCKLDGILYGSMDDDSFGSDSDSDSDSSSSSSHDELPQGKIESSMVDVSKLVDQNGYNDNNDKNETVEPRGNKSNNSIITTDNNNAGIIRPDNLELATGSTHSNDYLKRNSMDYYGYSTDDSPVDYGYGDNIVQDALWTR